MARRIVWITAAGTVALVVWGMLFWGLLAGPLGLFHELPNATAVTKELVGAQVPTGTYFMPWPRNTPAAAQRFLRQHLDGPFYRLSYVREGVDPQSVGKLVVGTLQYALVALLAAGLLAVARPATRRQTFLVVLVAGAMGTLFGVPSDPIWFHLPWDNARGLLLYELVGWAFLAAVAAFFWRGPTPSAR